MAGPPTALLPIPRVTPTRRGVRVEIPARFPSYAPIVLGAWLAAWAAGLLLLVLGWAGVRVSPIPPTLPGSILSVVYVAAGLFVAYRLAWVLRGRERVLLRDGELVIERGLRATGGRARKYRWDDVRGMKVVSGHSAGIYPSWGRLFVGQGDAGVEFDYEGRSHAFGRGLRAREAEELLDILLSSGGRA